MVCLKCKVELKLNLENQMQWQDVYEKARLFANELGLKDIKEAHLGRADYMYADEIISYSVGSTKAWRACYSSKKGRRINEFVLYEDLKTYPNGLLVWDEIEDQDILSLINFIENSVRKKSQDILEKEQKTLTMYQEYHQLYKDEFKRFMKMNDFAKSLFFVFSFNDIILQKSIWDKIFRELSNKEHIEPFYILAKVDKTDEEINDFRVSLLSDMEKLSYYWRQIN